MCRRWRMTIMKSVNGLLLLLGVIGCSFIQHVAGGGRSGLDGGGGGQGMVSRSIGTRVEFKIAEELPANTYVGQIPTKSGFTYRFNEQLDEFVLNAATGEIRTGKVIDRENLSSNHFDLVILSSQPVYPVEVRITVEDVNEFPPLFPEPDIEVTFSESVSSGTRVFLDTATDLDSGVNGVTSEYQIVSGNEEEHFRLAVTPNPSGDAPFLHLETTGKLDREAIASYKLNVSAQDGGSPPKFGFLIVNVIVLDINNNPPIFDHSDYVVSLNESAAMGTSVLQVRATDNDEGDNAKVTYYLSSTERQFSIDPETGDIFTMQQPLVCQKSCPQSHQTCSKSCVFTVFAHDHGIPRQDGRTYVTVNLIDTNDHVPAIKFIYFPPTASSASVDENAQNGSVVAAISILDMDEGLNGETTVNILTGNELKHFRLESTPSFQLLRVNAVLDREKIGRYNLTIVATDKGSPARSSTAFLVIQVNDINDHLPIFEKTEYSAVLRELAPIGTYVESITAQDEDTGINSQVFYSFVSGNENMWFHIDSSTGLLTTINHLDREVQDTVRLKIAARDGGPNPKWAQTQIKITILDVNERPEFTTERVNVTISEDALPGSLIAKVQAIDNDQGRNGSVTYSFSNETQDSYPEIFHLDSSNGQISIKTSLDRESLGFYEIMIIANDQGIPSLSSSVTIQLTLSDVNDNVPHIYPINYFVSISSSESAIGQDIGQIRATDADVGLNAKLFYYFATEENDNSDLAAHQRYFSIDEETGHIRLKQSVRSLENSAVKFRVSVRDGGGLQASESALVEIWIMRDVQMVKRLKFSESTYTFHLTEHPNIANGLPSTDPMEVGKVVLDTAGTESTDTGSVSFKILGGDEQRIFEIDERTGKIHAIKSLDREAKSLYKLTIGGFLKQEAYGLCAVNIVVENVNDCHPTFAKKRVALTLPSSAAVGSEVYLAKAIDLDNEQLAYTLIQNPQDSFTINSSNGIVSLVKPLRYSKSKANELVVQVQASDNGHPSLSSQQMIFFSVWSVNEHTPVFDHTSYETSILESTRVNLRFFALHATDEDDDENGQIVYQITEGNELNKFGIFPDGQLYLKNAIDRELQAHFSLSVTARDNGTPSRSSTVSILIHVIDENDNKPQFQGNELGEKIKNSADENQEFIASGDFTNKTFIFYLDENDDADSYVGRVFATDLDEGPNAELTYSIPMVQNDFIVDSKNGFIRSLKSFDREHLLRTTGHTFISYQVTVQDNGIVRLKDTAQLVVWIQDVNDNYPIFMKRTYSVQVSESSAVGTQILRVLATDEDEGLNGDILYYFGHKTTEQEKTLFKLDSATGQITLAGHLDRESQASYTLTVVAQDMAKQNPLNSTTSVTIVVTDENDNSPTFAQSEAFISVLETVAMNSELIRFQASDPDVGANKQVFYSISGGNRHDIFRIDMKSGSLFLNRPLDFERQTVHVLNITASDGGNPKLSSSLEFKVFVVDYNDMRPLFPSTAIVRQIVEGIPINNSIVTVTAEDADSGVNGQVTYSILSQEPLGSHFAIHSNSGLIYTTAEIDREETEAFRLVIQATDQAEPESIRLSGEKMVTIIVEDLNDNEPHIVSMNAALISKNMTKSDQIIQIHAIDLDSESNGIVTYELVHGDTSLFKLDRSSGSLTLTHQVHNLQPRYQLTIRATDEAKQSSRKSSELDLTILSVSEPTNTCTQLVFENTLYKGSIAENEPIGSSILTVKANIGSKASKVFSDNNSAPALDIEYYITNIVSKVGGEKQNKLFDVDVRRGLITTSSVLDHEMGPFIFHVEVYAILLSSNGVYTCKTKVEIEVLDQPDQPPKFEWIEKTLEVYENTRIGQEIITLVATDADTSSQIAYSIVQGDTGKFSLDSVAGTLLVQDTLDRETQEVYRLIVQASDGVQASNMTFLIQLTDSNDNEPRWEKSIYSFDIDEDAGQGSRIGQVKANDPDKGINGVVTYLVISDWGNDVFVVDPQTGVFTLTGRLDYEEVQHYIFVVQAQDGGYPSLSSTATVYLNVQDLNDNSPEFSIGSQENTLIGNPTFNSMGYNKEVYENVSIGSPLLTVTATDKDSGLNGKVSYSIIAGNDDDLFEITENGTIITKLGLDRETKAAHTLTVLASDEGLLNQLSSSVQVVITLRDINDAPPVFISENEAYVMENAALNTIVLIVKATDADEGGRNTYIEYNLNNEKNMFALGPVDGLLRVNGLIDRESRQNYTLKITARDRGEPSLSTVQNLFIRVVDTNDNAPTFDPKHYSAAMPENASLGMSVLQVSATDVDDGPNSQVHYSIVSGDPNGDFIIGEDSGVIRVAKKLNFERRRSYTLTLHAEDSGDQVLHDTATVTINVQNINDSPPTFLHSPYLVFVRENIHTIPATILHMNAHDADTGSQIRYLMKDGDKGSFRINASTGEVSVHRVLDREEQSEYLLTVVAMDTGMPRLSGTGLIRIVVEDANDNKPEFPHGEYEFLVQENTPIGTVISQITANDLDEGLNAKISYKFLETGPFTIDESNGMIKVARTIDREIQDVYHLTLEAQDSNPIIKHKTRTNITIRILDMNDNSPVWSPKFQGNFTVTIPDDLSSGSYVVGVSATDADIGLNGFVKYSLGGQDGDKFQINQITAVIKTLTNLKPISSHTYQIEIHATDSSPNDPLSVVTFINVRVAHSTQFPRIKPGSREFTFVETERNAVVTTIEVYPVEMNTKETRQAENERLLDTRQKNDSSLISRKYVSTNLNFVIGGGNLRNAFEVGRRSGQIKISSTGLDYELTHEYELWIEVFTDEQPELRASTSIKVKVLDANDNAPQLISKRDIEATSESTLQYHRSIFEVTVPEEEPGPKLVTTLYATDQDSGKNGQVKYRMGTESSKSFGNLFRVDPESGELYAKTKLDREEVGQYTLTVEAYDLGTPSKTGSASLIVTVTDINDHPPRFSRLFSVNVTENVPVGTFVIQVTSSDKDIGDNAKCTYSLVENLNNKFKIDPLTGNIIVNGMLDRELQDEYLLRVIAIDGSWRAETLVSITIQDVNDNSPVYDYSFYSFNVPEHDQPIAYVGQVTATDRDKRGPNSIVSYSLKTSSKFFTIDPISGEIFSKKSLKYKTGGKKKSPENEYNLIVVASDSGKPSTASECSVHINVIHRENHAPILEKEFYFSAVPSAFRSLTKILRVKASDELDYGINAELEYVQVGGNGSQYFTIDRESGWISVKEGVSFTPVNIMKKYNLEIEVKDKGIPPQGARATVELVVVDPNNNAPVFSALSYRVIVPENEALGSVIVTVNAVDRDKGPNGLVSYNITSGNEAGKFAINRLTGDVTIENELDCDTVSEYQLNITAYDAGYISLHSEAQLSIILTDVNDNPPTFDKMLYIGRVKENAPVNTQVMKLIATDIDSPKFSVVHYSIIGGNGRNMFAIDKLIGIIVSKQSFDYEDKVKYNLEVLATNPDSNLFCTTLVEIQIEGVNEFFPKFIQPVFHFSTSESAPIGSSIGMVQATDRDHGDDGIVYYLFIGSSNDGGFVINPTTGVLTVARLLDRETQSRVVLSVLAKNAGSIHGNDTDEAQVIVTIQDGNDPPVFENEVYQIQVKEDISIGSNIGFVKAHDIDVKPNNNRFTYKILNGNENETFKIDPYTGSVQTARQLDRETLDLFRLTIGAIDVGDPPQTGTTVVTIHVQDVQDNGPVLEQASTRGSVFENEPPNTKVMTLTATDADLSPNGEPFKYSIIGGLHREKFKVDKLSGNLYTTTTLDREAILDDIVLTVQIEDSGTPPLTTTQEIRITVKDVNDSPSQPRNTQILLYAFRSLVPDNEIANVQPLDPDLIGQYKCRIEDPEDIFVVPNNCNMFLRHWPKANKRHSVKVFGDDGQHAQVESTLNVEFLTFDNKTLENSIVIRIMNTSASVFVGKSYMPLRLFLRQIFQLQPHIYGVIPALNSSASMMDVIIAIGSDNNFEEPETITRTLQIHKAHLEAIVGSDAVIGYSPCATENTCLNGASCTQFLRAYPLQTFSESSHLILSFPTVHLEFSCLCPNGFTGVHCELRKEPCLPNPCENSAPCMKQGHRFQCICPANKHGKRCELDKHSSCDPNPCDNGGSCQLGQNNSPNGNAYFCLCRPGFYGSHCQTAIDACKPNPCQNGGECVSASNSLSSAYPVCKCSGHIYGRYCEKSGFGFALASFMRFPSLDSNTDDISIIFSTNKESALLVYNFGEQIGGRSDFLSIELLHGKVSFSFGGARTAVATVSVDKYVADGQWHRIVAIRNSRLISLAISDCEDSGDHCQECSLNDPSCYSSNQGFTGTLSFITDSLYIGGLKSVSAILERPGQIQTDDFIGCVHSVEVNGRMLNMQSPIESRLISDTCQRAVNVCQDKCGGASGQCIDLWDTHICNCGDFYSTNCVDAVAPFAISQGASIEFKIGEKYQRERVFRNMKTYNNRGTLKRLNLEMDEESLELSVRTMAMDGLLLYAASNRDYTLLELESGTLKFSSKVGPNHVIVMNLGEVQLNDGSWHHIKLSSKEKAIAVYIDYEQRGEELSAASAHNFLDPFLTTLVVGDVISDNILETRIPSGFEGCIANFSINGEIQPLNGSGSLFDATILYGKVAMGCSSPLGDTITAPDPLSIGVTLVIVFFVILLVAIFVSFGVFHLRKREKSPLPSVSSGTAIGLKHNSTGMLPTDVVRNHHLVVDPDPNALRNFVRNPKKLNDSMMGNYSNKPDVVIERDRNAPPPHNASHVLQNCNSGMIHSPMGSHNLNQLSNFVSMEPDISETPEHYDIENASSIAPSDIDIVYHYKGFRDNVRLPSRNKSSPFHHNHNYSSSPNHGHNSMSNLKNTPLARLSPSSELSHQTPRILTLQDISGKPLQSALLAATPKDAMTPSERSLNISQSSTRSSLTSPSRHRAKTKKKKRRKCSLSGSEGDGGVMNGSMVLAGGGAAIGLTAEEIERLNNSRHKNDSSLVSTLDAVSSSERDDDDEDVNNLRGRSCSSNNLNTSNLRIRRSNHLHHDSSSEAEDGESFTCSEFEYDHNM